MVYTSKKKPLSIFQLLGKCHCWWTKESPRARVAKFYDRHRLIRSSLRASKFSAIKIDKNCSYVGLLHHPIRLVYFIAYKTVNPVTQGLFYTYIL